jgi:hypothetical protein
VGDFDGDGDLDIAVANSGANSLSVYAGDGAGVFGAASILSVGQPPNTVATADFNSDGVLDLAIANSLIFPTGSDDLTILLGIGGGNFAAPQNFGIGGTVSRPSASIAVADFNRGGNLDVAIGHTNLNIVSIFLGNGAGSFRQKS